MKTKKGDYSFTIVRFNVQNCYGRVWVLAFCKSQHKFTLYSTNHTSIVVGALRFLMCNGQYKEYYKLQSITESLAGYAIGALHLQYHKRVKFYLLLFQVCLCMYKIFDVQWPVQRVLQITVYHRITGWLCHWRTTSTVPQESEILLTSISGMFVYVQNF